MGVEGRNGWSRRRCWRRGEARVRPKCCGDGNLVADMARFYTHPGPGGLAIDVTARRKPGKLHDGNDQSVMPARSSGIYRCDWPPAGSSVRLVRSRLPPVLPPFPGPMRRHILVSFYLRLLIEKQRTRSNKPSGSTTRTGQLLSLSARPLPGRRAPAAGGCTATPT